MNQINKVAVLGAGVMGATIAAHLANAGIQVLLLDIVPREPNEAEVKAGLGLTDAAVRNRIAADGLTGLMKMKPAAFFLPGYADYIETGNFDDDMGRLKECDWVVEVVIENMAIKKKLFTEKVVPNLKPGAILSTNTSGLSVNEMAECLPEEVRKNFLVTHFFNPPRYMRLMEIVSCRYTDPKVAEAMGNFLSTRLGKGIVTAKDTPNFIANRIGVYAICNCVRNMVSMGMTVEEVDAIAGPATARPKSAAFRTADLVGIDTLKHVADNSYQLLPNDEEREIFNFPSFVGEMVEKGLLGNKSRQGFFKKVKGEKGQEFFYYDYLTGEYKPATRPKFASVEAAKGIDDPGQRLKALIESKDKAGEFAWKNLRDTLIYTFNRIPEIADDVVNIDNGMKWGFNWELGPFEMLDAIGVSYFVNRAEKDGVTVPAALKNIERFYRFENGKREYLCVTGNQFREVPVAPGQVSLSIIRKNGGVVEKNSGASVLDLGDGVFCLEFHTKMNAIGGEILSMVHKGIKRAEQDGVGLVIANEGTIFSAGANLMLLVMAIAEGAYDEINMTINNFQKAMMAIKYSKIPVVAAPHNLVMGGGCETCLHSDAIIPYAETYMGLVEIGVGLLPGGGGTKEMAIRAIKLAEENDIDATPFIFKNFMNIAMAKVSMSAAELGPMGFLRQGDAITMNVDRRIHDAKLKAISLAANYRPGRPLVNLKAPGRGVAASIKSQLWNMQQGGFISEYDQFLAGTVADVITGGDIPSGTLITEQYLLDLEREGFLKLCGQKKTLERIQHMLKKGKPLRN
ncbi:3-hydroxyacyl-CoA dehydrogenase/enoyl-CoA hydratase family protein [Geomonas sp. Red32]|uniref:3-hydroxyacyl-CoA dehydrogenase/enoyl-CoA hydratase family protein n=1 Tax=Geomonas sp. Red32 TaxID=2912856 RepID=UPI00202CFE5E|nr:3-hydroxyacyl-CoA dehydrogenase/enoyl-CoA hydratase family protein [Geomonas sp. Red32]MCM0082161.1 3-hydroxyacyl-CoA dehydrogenase/enoyl-CoA hydratase family protein [Geomonas sp. Red32]